MREHNLRTPCNISFLKSKSCFLSTDYCPVFKTVLSKWSSYFYHNAFFLHVLPNDNQFLLYHFHYSFQLHKLPCSLHHICLQIHFYLSSHYDMCNHVTNTCYLCLYSNLCYFFRCFFIHFTSVLPLWLIWWEDFCHFLIGQFFSPNFHCFIKSFLTSLETFLIH